MQIISTILYIILFLLCLSLLIIIHEFGHFTMAKVFKVYCFEFSCGMGPLLFKKKRKNGETQFSLRAIPFGGYVSMYGEGAEIPEGVTIDESRSLTKIKAWKRALILIAGVTMNAILALIIFFIKNIAFTQTYFIASDAGNNNMVCNVVEVLDDSIASKAGFSDSDILHYEELVTLDNGSFGIVLNKEFNINYSDKDSIHGALVLDYSAATFNNPDYSLRFYKVEGGVVNLNKEINLTSNVTFVEGVIYCEPKEGDELISRNIRLNYNVDTLDDIGLRVYKISYKQNFKEAFKNTFKDFGTSSVGIFNALKMLFTDSQTYKQLTSVVGIGFETKTILDGFGVANFIYIWGFISVNLAIVNLLPFPGLDGWQLLVLIVESITKKKMPEKVKNIVSFVGIAILLAFMAFILFKDIWVYIIKGLF